MFKSLILYLFVAAILPLAAADRLILDGVFISGKTDKSALSYRKNETMIFSFRAEFGGKSSDGLFLSYIRRGDDGRTFSGKVPASQELIVKTSTDRPGFVSVNVLLVDADGRNVFNGSRKIGYYAGAAVEPEALEDCGEPADFDAFWQRQRQRVSAVPFDGAVEKKFVSTENGLNYFTVKIPCAGPRPVTGFLCIPVNAGAGSQLAEIHYMGSGEVPQKLPRWALKDRITLIINAHGHEMLQDAGYYAEFFKSIRSNGYTYALDPEQNRNPETSYFNGMALRVMRSLDYIKTLPEWNRKDLRVIGGSQGGLQVMWAAAMDEDISVAIPSIIWCSDLAGQEKKGRLHGTWRVKYDPALDYYDPVFMAKRIKKAEVYISRAGLGDYICPPSGLMICYKNIASPRKKIVWVQGSDHGFIPADSERIVWQGK